MTLILNLRHLKDVRLSISDSTINKDNSRSAGYKHKLKICFGYAAPFLLAVILLIMAFYGVDLLSVFLQLKYASLLWLSVLAVSVLLSHYFRALRWKVICKGIKADISTANLFGALMAGYGINNIIPRFGELTRSFLLGKWEGISKSSVLGTVVLERIIDMIAFGSALMISLFIYGAGIKEKFPWLITSLYLAAAAMAMLLLLLLMLIRYKARFSGLLVTLAGKISSKLAAKLNHIFHMLIEGFSSLSGARNYTVVFIYTAIIMLNYALNTYIGFKAMHLEELKEITFAMAWIFMSISSIGVMIPTPGGTGSYHALARSVMVLLFGFPQEISMAFGFITHIIPYFLHIITGVVCFFILSRRYTKRTGIRESMMDLIRPHENE